MWFFLKPQSNPLTFLSRVRHWCPSPTPSLFWVGCLTGVLLHSAYNPEPSPWPSRLWSIRVCLLLCLLLPLLTLPLMLGQVRLFPVMARGLCVFCFLCQNFYTIMASTFSSSDGSLEVSSSEKLSCLKLDAHPAPHPHSHHFVSVCYFLLALIHESRLRILVIFEFVFLLFLDRI